MKNEIVFVLSTETAVRLHDALKRVEETGGQVVGLYIDKDANGNPQGVIVVET